MLRSSSWLNETPVWRTAVKSFTGIAIIPNEMVPLQIDLDIVIGRYMRASSLNPARGAAVGVSNTHRSLRCGP